MAGRPLEAMALVGLGLRILSMQPANIGPVKMMIRSIDSREVAEFVERMLGRTDHSLRTRLACTDHSLRTPLAAFVGARARVREITGPAAWPCSLPVARRTRAGRRAAPRRGRHRRRGSDIRRAGPTVSTRSEEHTFE